MTEKTRTPETQAGDAVAEAKSQIQDAAHEAIKNVTEAADGARDKTIAELKEASEKAQKEIDDTSTQGIQDKVDAAKEKFRDTASQLGETVKAGFADHGIDTDKLGSALKEDAKSAAKGAVAGAKFVGEKITDFVSGLQGATSDGAEPADEETKDESADKAE